MNWKLFFQPNSKKLLVFLVILAVVSLSLFFVIDRESSVPLQIFEKRMTPCLFENPPGIIADCFAFFLLPYNLFLNMIVYYSFSCLIASSDGRKILKPNPKKIIVFLILVSLVASILLFGDRKYPVPLPNFEFKLTTYPCYDETGQEIITPEVFTRCGQFNILFINLAQNTILYYIISCIIATMFLNKKK